MAVGATIGRDQIDNTITAQSVSLRNGMQEIRNLDMSVNGQGNGLAYLESIGYDTAANPANPGGVSDAQYALNMISYLNTVAEVYFGQATQASAFDFNGALSQMWAGQVG